MKNSRFQLAVFPLIFLLVFSFNCKKQEEKAAAEEKPKEEMAPQEKAGEDLQLDKIPQEVMDTLKAKFPEAEIHKWTKEKEEDFVIYDMEFKQGDRKFEADIKKDGSIYNWEKEIEPGELPESVRKVVESKYPNSTIKEIMEITVVEEGEDVLEGYEVVLETEDMKEAEITVGPECKILEEESEEEEKKVEK